MRGRRPRRREPWGKRPNGPAKRYVRLFVYAILAVALIGRLSVSSRGAATEAYYRSSADAWGLRERTLGTVEDVVTHTHPAAVGAAQSTHVHLPGGGYFCAWVAPRSKSEASRPAVWASRRVAIEEATLGDAENAGDSGDGKSPWSAPFALARAPGAPATHRDPALFFADGVLRLHFRAGDEEEATSPYTAASTDGGETWSAVASLRGENAGKTASSATDACAVGGSLPARPGSNGAATAIACVGAIDVGDTADGLSEHAGKGGVAVLRSADAGRAFARAAAVAVGGTRVAAASLWRGAEASAAAGGKHVTSLVMLGADGLVYRAESLDLGATWGNAARLDPETLDARAAPAGGVSVAPVGRRASGMARVFFLPSLSAENAGEGADADADADADARIVVRLRLSDDGGATWPLWLDVPVPGGCAPSPRFSRAGEPFANDKSAGTFSCASPVLEPWPERAEGFTLTRGAGGAGGIAFAATSLRAFRRDASVGSDSDASSGASAGV